MRKFERHLNRTATNLRARCGTYMYEQMFVLMHHRCQPGVITASSVGRFARFARFDACGRFGGVPCRTVRRAHLPEANQAAAIHQTRSTAKWR